MKYSQPAISVTTTKDEIMPRTSCDGFKCNSYTCNHRHFCNNGFSCKSFKGSI